MIRQAHTYLAGAVSGTALIGAAVVAFVLLVSLQALRDWPLAGIGGGGDGAAVSSGRPAGGEGAAATAGPTGAAAAAGATARQGKSQPGGNQVERVGDGGTSADVGTPPATESPVAEVPGPAPGSTGSPSPAASAPANGSGSGNGNGGGAGPGTSAAGGGGAGGGSTSGAVTGTVNDTVAGVDKVVGGALSETGVTQATEEVVNGVAGPSSPVGKTVDKVVETVDGLLGGKR